MSRTPGLFSLPPAFLFILLFLSSSVLYLHLCFPFWALSRHFHPDAPRFLLRSQPNLSTEEQIKKHLRRKKKKLSHVFYMEHNANRELLVIRKKKSMGREKDEKTDEVGGARSWKRRKEGEGKWWRGAKIIGRRIIAIVFSKQTKHESCRRGQWDRWQWRNVLSGVSEC